MNDGLQTTFSLSRPISWPFALNTLRTSVVYCYEPLRTISQAQVIGVWIANGLRAMWPKGYSSVGGSLHHTTTGMP